MRIRDANWMAIAEYLERDDRAVLPLGSTEQHAYLSMATDAILAERVAAEAAEPLGIPVFPVMSYGVSPYFLGFPGTVTLRLETYLAVIGDILDCLAMGGFKRILMVNGHGGNSPASSKAIEWRIRHPDVRVRLHNWWNAPAMWAKVKETDDVASHASWMENFPWTRLEGVALPDARKTPIDHARMAAMTPAEVRDYLGDGNFAGYYQRDDAEMQAIWETGVAETRRALEGPWQ